MDLVWTVQSIAPVLQDSVTFIVCSDDPLSSTVLRLKKKNDKPFCKCAVLVSP